MRAAVVEALFTEFIVEHSLPLACAEYTGPLFIATKYGCARKKTACQRL